jgi:photosystem II stability/assembly factor-like uncharacterized protein
MEWQKFSLILVFCLILPLSTFADWEQFGLPDRSVTQMKIYDSYLYAATDNGLWQRNISSDDSTWRSLGLEEFKINDFLVFDNGEIMAIKETGASILRTTDGGLTWLPYQNGFIGSAYAMDQIPSQDDTLFVTGPAVIGRSTDHGLSWEPVAGDWDTWGEGINFVHVYRQNSNIIWAGTDGMFFQPVIFKSTNRGTDWTITFPEVGGDNISLCIAIDPTDENRVFIGMSYLLAYTSDGGQTWQVNDEFNFIIQGLQIDPLNPDIIYLSGITDSPEERLNVFRSRDGGVNWTDISIEMETEGWDNSLLFHRSAEQTYLFAGSPSNGVWLNRDFVSIPDQNASVLPLNISLDPAYPNPFNPSTTITYSIPENGVVTLSVFNINGRLVDVLVSGKQEAGIHEIGFDGSNLTSGIYFYQLQSAETTLCKKMLLVK